MIASWEENIMDGPKGKNFRCSRCNHETPLYFQDKIEIYACPKCSSVFSKNDKLQNKISKHKNEGIKPILPLYSKCTFFGIKYTLVGFARKQQLGGHTIKWEEYTLISENGEPAYLNQAYGHWSLFTICEKPKNYDPKDSYLKHDDTLGYDLLASYKHKATAFVGQFYYDIVDVSKRVTREYTNPPHVFTNEYYEGRNEYFNGIYLKESKLRNAFEEELVNLPEMDGIGDYQPFYFGIKPGRFGRLALVFFALALLTHLILAPSMETETNYPSIKAEITDSVKTAKVVTESFKVLGNNPIELRFECNANVYNDWMEAAITIINDDTGEEKSFVTGIELYAGVDSDGSWTEGSSKKTEYVGNITPGTYHIEAEIYGSNAIGRSKTFSATVIGQTATAWNFWIIMLIYGVIAIAVMVLGANFENKRLGL
ncbi:MAG: hypothetical protein IT236_14170 [Bacteroidia bacterium]|nr:hypothetical protein [Bacteroidia bacterium]